MSLKANFLFIRLSVLCKAWNRSEERAALTKNLRARLPELLFLAAFILGVFRTILSFTAFETDSFKLMTYFSVLLLIGKIVLTRYRPRELPVMAAFLFLCLLTFYVSRNNAFVFLGFVLLASKGVDLRKVMRATLVTVTATTLLVIFCSLTGIVKKYRIFSISRGDTYIYRYGLGFGHPNSLQAAFLIAAALFLYLEFRRHFLPALLSVGVLNVGMYFVTQSRTGAAAVFCMILLAILYRLPKTSEKATRCSGALFLLIVLTQLALTFTYRKGSPFSNLADGLLQGRVMQSNFYLQEYHVSALGHNMAELGAAGFHYVLDFGYARLLINFGWVVLLLYIYANIHTILACSARKKPEIVLLIMTFGVAGFGENYIYYIFLNVSMLFFSWLLFGGALYRNRALNRLAAWMPLHCKGYVPARALLRRHLRRWLEQ